MNLNQQTLACAEWKAHLFDSGRNENRGVVRQRRSHPACINGMSKCTPLHSIGEPFAAIRAMERIKVGFTI